VLVLAQFVSARPSQPVRSPPPDMERPLKTARSGGILQIWAGLRVRKLATEAPLRLPVSAGGRWCLVLRSILQRNHEVVAQAVIGPELVEQVS